MQQIAYGSWSNNRDGLFLCKFDTYWKLLMNARENNYTYQDQIVNDVDVGSWNIGKCSTETLKWRNFKTICLTKPRSLGMEGDGVIDVLLKYNDSRKLVSGGEYLMYM